MLAARPLPPRRGANGAPPTTRTAISRFGLLLGALLLAGAVGPARAQRAPLPEVEQRAVHQAVDRGVLLLKRTQGPRGTWAADKAPHQVGYAALPGLTLLECGVPASDPVVHRAAAAARRGARTVDTTYELALTILFLDRLGDPKDKALIQSLSLRLMAGQTATGGWGYKCPTVDASLQREMLLTLNKLSPPVTVVAVRPPAGKPVLDPGGPGGKPVGGGERPGGKPVMEPGAGPGDKPVLKPGEPGGKPVGGDKPGDPGRPVLKDPPGGAGTPTSPGEGTSGGTGSPPGSTLPGSAEPGGATPDLKGGKKSDDADDPWRERGPALRLGTGFAHGARCIKASEWAGDDRRAASPEEPPNPNRGTVVVPPRLRRLPVFQEPELQGMVDPKGRSQQPLLATTDNSNTQFALLALWAAKRHGVPVDRSLRLIVRRFQTSQNRDGSWGYHYRLGGGEAERPAMTCVGLLGLAVGHGLAADGADRKAVDPAIVNGFVALKKHVGTPAGRMDGLPMANLYVLWSIERVAVLYNLPKIAGLDWYRWAAEILVANQQRLGHWEKGLYHGNSPVIDTCLALLVLKRANLAEDLGERLPFDPALLDQSITDKAKLGERPAKPEKPEGDLGEAERKAVPPGGFLPVVGALPAANPGGAVPAADAARKDTKEEEAAEESARRPRWPWLLLILAGVLLGTAIACVVVTRKGADNRPRRHRPRARAHH